MEVAEQKMLKVPNLRFREFEDGWCEQTLGDLLNFKNGVNAEKGQYGSGYKFINVLDIIQNDFITHDVILGEVELSDKEVEKNEVRYGDILFQRSSETREEVGQSNVYLDKEKTAVFGGFVIRGRGKKDYNPSFMNGMLKTDQARKEITTRSGGSTRYNIGQESLEAVTVFTPTLPEQQKIASFLSAVDERLGHLARKKQLLEQYKKGVMQQLFSQHLRFKREDGSDYEDWEEKRLGELCFKKSTTLAANSISENSGQYKVFGASGVCALVDFFMEESPYVAVVKDGAGVGRTVLCEGYSSALGTLQVIQQNDKSDLLFLYYVIQNLDFTKYITGSTIPHVYFKDYASELIATPSLKEQQKIADFLSSLDKKIDAVSTQMALTQQFKKGLLQEMFV